MDPIDLTHPDDVNWMKEEDPEPASLSYRDQMTHADINSNVGAQLLPVVEQEIADRNVGNSSEYETMAREAITDHSVPEIESFYKEASSEVEPSEVTSLDFVDDIDAYVASEIVDSYFEE